MKLSDFLLQHRLSTIDVVTAEDLIFVPNPSVIYSQYYRRLVSIGASPFQNISNEKFHSIVTNITSYIFNNKLGEINPHGQKLFRIKALPLGHAYNFGEIQIVGLFYRSNDKHSFEIHLIEG